MLSIILMCILLVWSFIAPNYAIKIAGDWVTISTTTDWLNVKCLSCAWFLVKNDSWVSLLNSACCPCTLLFHLAKISEKVESKKVKRKFDKSMTFFMSSMTVYEKLSATNYICNNFFWNPNKPFVSYSNYFFVIKKV